ncbi:MAG: hypothetical protein JSU86_03855 [Phycisphaerales bacterium]|nr:MAG: hypothetical protein JSU86_03855 [Phycisphaerales bacterium]
MKWLELLIAVCLVASCACDRRAVRSGPGTNHTIVEAGTAAWPRWVRIPSWAHKLAGASEDALRAPSSYAMRARLVTLYFYSAEAWDQFQTAIGGGDKVSGGKMLVLEPWDGTTIIEWMHRHPRTAIHYGTNLALSDGRATWAVSTTVGSDDGDAECIRYDDQPGQVCLIRYSQQNAVRDRYESIIRPIRRLTIEGRVSMRPGQSALKVAQFATERYPVAVMLQTWQLPIEPETTDNPDNSESRSSGQ